MATSNLTFLLCLQYAPKLATLLQLSWNILISEWSIRVFHYKVTVLLESIDLRIYVNAFGCSIAVVVSTDCSIGKY